MKFSEDEKTSQENTSNDSHSGSSSIPNESIFSSIPSSSPDNQCFTSSSIFTIDDLSSTTFNKVNQHQSSLFCPALTQLSRHGPIHVSSHNKRVFISKIHQISIEDNYNELIDQGKYVIGNYSSYELTIPEMSYWYQRYYYYLKFDEGIKMDYESWYSVTPEPIAKYIARLVKGKIVIDGFCGSGGNAIQFSRQCKKVYAIDIDKAKLSLCTNNCRIYKCKPNIEFINSDFLKMSNKLKGADYVFLSPPWGGLEYKSNDIYDIHKLMTPNVYDIIRVSLSLAKHIIFYLPRNLNPEDLYEVISDIKNEMGEGTGNHLCFDVQVIKSNAKIKALLIVFGYEVNEIITESDMHGYITNNYDYVDYNNKNLVWMITKMVGLYSFFVNEMEFKANCRVESYSYSYNVNQLIRMFMGSVLDEESKKSLEKIYFGNENKRSYGCGCYYRKNTHYRLKHKKVAQLKS